MCLKMLKICSCSISFSDSFSHTTTCLLACEFVVWERTLIMNAPRGGGGVRQMQSVEFRGEGGCWAGEFERILSPVIEAIFL